MAVERQVGSMTDAKPSTVDLTGKEYHFAKRVAGGFALCGNKEKPAGVISEGKAVGLHTSVNTGNQLKVVASAAIAVGDKVGSDANGKAVVAAATWYAFGEAISAADANELVTINVTNEGIVA